MIYIGVGPDPFKKSGKRGLGRGWSSTIQKKMSSWRPMNQIPSLGHGLSCNRQSRCLHQVRFLLFSRRTSQATSLGIIGILDYSFLKKVILFRFMGPCFMCTHAHTVVGIMFVTTWQYSPLSDLLLERNGQAVQAVKRCGECILSFLPLYSICCRDVTSRWMHFLSVLKVH